MKDIELEIKRLIESNDPQAADYKELYIKGIHMAHGWWQQAQVTGSPSEAGFKRILDGAIEKYNELFNQ
jgi:hypothetical protein